MAQQFIDNTEPDADTLAEGADKVNANFSEVYGRTDDLAGGTTGQVLKKNSNTSHDFVWGAESGGGVTDHGALTGLADDDHTQYHTDARGDARYPPLTRTISTTAPLTGGGDFSANRTLGVSAASATAQGVVELATDAEAQTGTDTARAITPANLTARTATETRTGVVELATDAETQTGTDTARAITPANLTARTATETRTGVVELATTAEVTTGTDTARAVTPAGVAAALSGGGGGYRGMSGYRTSTTSLSATTPLKVQLETIEWDTASRWDATNHRYLPLVAGYYRVSAASPSQATVGHVTWGYCYKNGVLERVLYRNITNFAVSIISAGTVQVFLNGSTDYVEFFVEANVASTLPAAGKSTFYFQIQYLGA